MIRLFLHRSPVSIIMALTAYRLITIVVAVPATFANNWPAGTPSFPEYPGRNVVTLSGAWEFGFSSEYQPNVSTSLKGITFNRTEIVPGAWDAAWGTGIQYTRGVGVYRTQVTVPAGHPSVLHFAACSLFCRVYVDGKLLHNHTIGGFTAFWVTVPVSMTLGVRTLVVLTSNVFSSTLTPTQFENYDFYQYGGLIRPVCLHVLPRKGPSIQRVEVIPLAEEGAERPSGQVNLTLILRPPMPSFDDILASGSADKVAANGSTRQVRVQLSWDGKVTQTLNLSVDLNDRAFLPNVLVPDAQPWIPAGSVAASKAPAASLHVLTLRVANGARAAGMGPLADASGVDVSYVDAIRVRVGLRVIRASGREIRVNGETVKLRGFNRHDMYPQLGPSLSAAQYASDVSQLQSALHANFVRGAHYPQDARLLDLADERGLLVWNEALAWGNWADTLTAPAFLGAELASAHAMLDEAINHPSILLWGFFNEGQSDDPKATPAYAAMAAVFRGRDPSRLVTWANNRLQRDLGLAHADVLSFNYYPGW